MVKLEKTIVLILGIVLLWGCRNAEEQLSPNKLAKDACTIYEQCDNDGFVEEYDDYLSCVAYVENTHKVNTQDMADYSSEECVELYFSFYDCQHEYIFENGCEEDQVFEPYIHCEYLQDELNICWGIDVP